MHTYCTHVCASGLESGNNSQCSLSVFLHYIYILRSTGHIIDLPTPTSLTYKHVYLAVYMRTHHRPSLCLWKANYKNYNFFLV